MLDGYAHLGVCYRQAPEALAAVCSAINGTPSGGGVLTCSAPAWDPNAANWVSYNLALESPGDYISKTGYLYLAPCEPLDFEYWAPVIGVWFLALVTIICARLVYTRVFHRESTV